MSRKKNKFKESLITNNLTYSLYQRRLTELAVSCFEWVNLPPSIDPTFLELTLFNNGSAVFFKDEILGFLALPVTSDGALNIYRLPTKRTAYATNGYHIPLTENNSVIIFNNKLKTNSVLDVEMYSKRLWNYDRIIDTNINAQKTPILIGCDENERLTMENLYMQYDGNEPVIFGRNDLKSSNPLTVLKTDAPFVADKIYDMKSKLWNEALTYLGISNTQVTKKERLIRDEVQRDLGGVFANRFSRLDSRRKACEEINAMFNLDISVQWREEGENEQIYNGS